VSAGRQHLWLAAQLLGELVELVPDGNHEPYRPIPEL
jgi:hypothetical protein